MKSQSKCNNKFKNFTTFIQTTTVEVIRQWEQFKCYFFKRNRKYLYSQTISQYCGHDGKTNFHNLGNKWQLYEANTLCKHE